MRIFAASLATETNTFSPIPTSRRSFEASFYAPPGKHPDEPKLCTRAALRRAPAGQGGGLHDDRGLLLLGGAIGHGGAPTTSPCAMRSWASSRDAMPVDAVLLGLHGAFVAEGYDDVEGDLARARARHRRGRLRDRLRVRPALPHDGEAHPPRHRLDRVQGVPARRFPASAARSWSSWCCRPCAARSSRWPRSTTRACGISSRPRSSRCAPSSTASRRSRARTASSMSRSRTASCMPTCRTWARGCSSTPTDARLTATASRAISARRSSPTAASGAPPTLDMGAAFTAALAHNGRLAIIAEPSDNAGGGAASDCTLAIHELIRRKVDRCAVAPVWDPIAVEFCMMAGPGARMALRFGGKAAAKSGPPVDAEVEVLATKRSGWQMFGSARVGRRRYGGGAHRRRRRDPDRQAHAGLRHRALHPARPRSHRATA